MAGESGRGGFVFLPEIRIALYKYLPSKLNENGQFHYPVIYQKISSSKLLYIDQTNCYLKMLSKRKITSVKIEH